MVERRGTGRGTAGPFPGRGLAVGAAITILVLFSQPAAPQGQTERIFDYEELEPVAVKGKAEPLPLFRPLQARARFGSDVTRTLWVTGGSDANGPDERFRHLFAVLQAAQATATSAVGPGVSCEAIDVAARSIIDAEGYGEAFFHRTGHGIGLDGHEEPYLIGGNDLPLRAGMAFSVEPGIYLPGVYGARIEDIVVCGEDGPVVLNEAPRELIVVEG